MITSITLFLLNHYTFCMVIMGSCILGITSACIGSFALLRHQSLLGDAVSHAALPGIAIAFLLTCSKNPWVLMIGGTISGILSTVIIMFLTKKTRLKIDTILGITLSVFFGLGLVLMSHIQKYPIAEQAILNKFIFGSASTLLPDDIFLMSGIGIFVIFCIILFWKEFTVLSFDAPFAHSLGYSVTLLDTLLTFLLVLTIIIGLQTVGVILMSTMLIAPAAAARQLTQRLKSMVLVASFIGACAAITGSIISCSIAHLPTGPTIVLVLSLFVLFSFLFSPIRSCT